MTRLKDAAEFYEPLYKKRGGVFFRGTCSEKPKKPRYGTWALGYGTYLTWDREMAGVFAKASSGPPGKPVVETFEVPPGLKLLDATSKTMFSAKDSVGLKWDEYATDPVQARALSYEISRQGWDGVVSDETTEGMVVFDKEKLKLLKREAVK